MNLGSMEVSERCIDALGPQYMLESFELSINLRKVKGRENEPVYLDSHSPILRLTQMIRDETHRYAVTYHRKRRDRPQDRDRDRRSLRAPARSGRRR